MKKIYIFVSILVVIFMISFVSAGIFSKITGKVLWDWNHCTKSNPCPVGEGDCDQNSTCMTGYCAQNVGPKYN